jgi:2-polyprenyl-6-methoxyphenol hydroxylase-like FAD-dependent oxidoreductase
VLLSVVNPNDSGPRYVGQLVFWGFTPDRQWGSTDDMHIIAGENLAFGYIPISSGTYWFARVTAPEKSREELAEMDFSAFLAESLIALPQEIAATAQPYGANSYDLPFVSQWSGGGVLLIGDAAHAASPATGQGGGYALEDAFVIGKAVRDRGELAEAVGSFERARRGRTQANIVASARMCTGPETLADAPQGSTLDPAEALTQVQWGVPLPA